MDTHRQEEVVDLHLSVIDSLANAVLVLSIPGYVHSSSLRYPIERRTSPLLGVRATTFNPCVSRTPVSEFAVSAFYTHRSRFAAFLTASEGFRKHPFEGISTLTKFLSRDRYANHGSRRVIGLQGCIALSFFIQLATVRHDLYPFLPTLSKDNYPMLQVNLGGSEAQWSQNNVPTVYAVLRIAGTRTL